MRAALAWAPFLLWCGLVFWLSSRPGDEVAPLLPPIPFGDKLLHAVEYAVGGALAYFALLEGHGRQLVWAAAAIATLYGVTDELHQALGDAGRDGDPFDLLADAAGALLGAFVAWRLWRRDDAVSSR